LTLRDRPSRSPLDGDIRELMRETVDDDFDAAAAETVNNAMLSTQHVRTESATCQFLKSISSC